MRWAESEYMNKPHHQFTTRLNFHNLLVNGCEILDNFVIRTKRVFPGTVYC
jgi:hypothetical protein